MRKLIIGLIVLFTFQRCTNELSETENPNQQSTDAEVFNGDNISLPTESFLVQYFSNEDNRTISYNIENEIKHDFNRPQTKSIQPGQLSARWSGKFNFEKGEYEFNLKSDKGIEVKIDGETVLSDLENRKSQDFKILHKMDGTHQLDIIYNPSSTNTYAMDSIQIEKLGGIHGVPVVNISDQSSTIAFNWAISKNDKNARVAYADQAKLVPMGWAASTTTGGKGGKIIKVTNLKKDGAGSLKAAIAASGKRIIVFEVGGIIDLAGTKLDIKNDNVTIMGQTAPNPGITLIRGPLQVKANNVILEHIRVRVGNAGKTSNWAPDGICVLNAHNVIIDHCSVAWSIDEGLTVTGSDFKGSSVSEWRKNTSGTVTISNSIIGEPLHKSTHSQGSHGYGTLIGRNVRELAILRNLYVNNTYRNPLATGGTSVAIVNNYIYNPKKWFFQYELKSSKWGSRTKVPGSISIVENNAKIGPNTKDALFFLHDGGDIALHWKDNRTIGKSISSSRIIKSVSGGKLSLISSPKSDAWHSSIQKLGAQNAESHVLANAGARPWDRDQVDIRIINGVKNGTIKNIDSQNQVGGYPSATPTYRKFDPSEWNL